MLIFIWRGSESIVPLLLHRVQPLLSQRYRASKIRDAYAHTRKLERVTLFLEVNYPPNAPTLPILSLGVSEKELCESSWESFFARTQDRAYL